MSTKAEVKNTKAINTIALFSNSVSEKIPTTHPMKQTVPINKAIFKITIELRMIPLVRAKITANKRERVKVKNNFPKRNSRYLLRRP